MRAAVSDIREKTARAAERVRPEFEEMRARYPSPRAALIPLLRRFQEEIGYLPLGALRIAAKWTGISPGEVQRVATFYTMFFTEPVGRFVISVCSTLSCELAGSEDVIGAIEEELGIREGETTDDGLFTLRRVECLGWCDRAPVVQVNEEDYIDDLTPEKASDLVRRLRERASAEEGASPGERGS